MEKTKDIMDELGVKQLHKTQNEKQNNPLSNTSGSISELEIFLTSLTLTLLIITNWTLLKKIELYSDDLLIIFPGFFLLIGYILSIYYVFSKRKKTIPEKKILASYILFTRGMILLAIAMMLTTMPTIYLLVKTQMPSEALTVLPSPLQILFLILFAAINFIKAFKLLSKLNRNNKIYLLISDKNTESKTLLIAIPSLIILFLIGQYILNMHWGINALMCITYSLLISEHYAKK